MRSTHGLSALLLAVTVACGGTGGGSGDVDTALLTRAGGDVMLAGGRRLPYEITSDRYRQWEAARRALRAQRISLTMRLDPLRVTEAEIERAVSFFERNGKARRTIENAGMSVRDYVLTTIALEQQMAVATGRWGERERPRVPAAPVAPSESISAELARDTARVKVDTVPVVDTVVVPVDTVPDTTAAGRGRTTR
ncbi:MAG: hypothetical protein ABR499_19595 [Gemmatimonadaceae bacterium]